VRSIQDNRPSGQRSKDQKRLLIERALREPTIAAKSNRKIAELYNVSHTFVANVRAEMLESRKDRLVRKLRHLRSEISRIEEELLAEPVDELEPENN
jgi:hypothetical protein